MEIVSYNVKDSHEVTAFFREIFSELGWKESVSDHMDEPHLLFHLPDKGLLLLAKENSRIIATAGVIVFNTTDGLIKRFYINKIHRGTGIAQQLLDRLTMEAKALGVKRLILDVSKNNTRAIKFYEKSGFLPTDVTPQKGWPESREPETHLYFYKPILMKQDQ